MSDVLIRNLHVRIIRKGSLLWGDDPRRLARRAIAALPQLLADQLEEMGAGEGPGEITTPVRISLRGSLDSLLESLATQEGTPRLRALVREALEQALGPEGFQRSSLAPSPEQQAPPPPRAPGPAPLGELLQLHLRGELGAALEGFTLELLEAYHRALLELPPPGGAPARVLSAEEHVEAKRFIEAFAASLGSAAGRRHGLQQRLLAVVNLAASTGIPPFDARVRASVNQWIPLIPAEHGITPEHPLGKAAGEAEPAGAGASSGALDSDAGVSSGTSNSGNAPGMETRKGRGNPLEPVTVSSSGAPGLTKRADSLNGQEDDPALRQTPPGSMAPGDKAPTPAGRGGTSLSSAGHPNALPGQPPRSATKDARVANVEQPAPILPLLVAGLLSRAGVVARVRQHLAGAGYAEELPLWVAALAFKLGPPPVRGWRYTPEVWAHAALVSGNNLFSGEGLVRLADAPSSRWPELTHLLVQVLAPEGVPLVAVPHGSGVALMTEAPLAPVWAGPAEDATLRSAAEGHRLLRHSQLAPGLLPESESCSSALEDGMQETLAELERRPACALATQPHFDRHLGTVTGWALARIGATLWPQETPPLPLVLERFASLEVYLRRDEEGLAVRVPLGKRHADLSRAGFLADIPRVPWLFGGAIRFRGA